MQEISFNILDIAQNSIRAKADLIEIEIVEAPSRDEFSFSVTDNGCGMDEELLKRVMDPFTTTRTTRKVGLGIPLLRMAAQQTGGDVYIKSEIGKGTELKAVFSYCHIDRQPLGDIAGTMVSLISMNTDIDFVYRHYFEDTEFILDTRELRAILGEEVKFSEPSVAMWIGEFINSNIYGGAN